ncbi:unnamed protein product [Oppiella nova]|uniref:Uncharacterized protein n=1 Tax=Oppiella nova TaxID=334625 RepID=A0A7R9QW71_9ACAR|nr:unnamed protein product [Oppiella nova]CAG2176587.1 unnamed protein product [Oppiella nova]
MSVKFVGVYGKWDVDKDGVGVIYCAECKNSTEGVKVIATFKQCIGAYPTGQEINKQGDQLKAKGTDTCITEFNKYIDSTKGKEDKDQDKLKACAQSLFKANEF